MSPKQGQRLQRFQIRHRGQLRTRQAKSGRRRELNGMALEVGGKEETHQQIPKDPPHAFEPAVVAMSGITCATER